MIHFLQLGPDSRIDRWVVIIPVTYADTIEFFHRVYEVQFPLYFREAIPYFEESGDTCVLVTNRVTDRES